MTHSLFYKALLLAFYICILTASVIPKDASKVDPLSDEAHSKDGEHNDKYDHDAFLGADEADIYDSLSPEESKERLGKLLPKIDTDSDGFITEAELKAHIKFMQDRYVKTDVDRTWTSHKPHDGKLEWKIYKETIYGGDDREVDESYKKMMDRDEKRWSIADANKDGALDLDEYSCFMHPEGCEHMKENVVLETVADIDKNEDGVIDVEEYISDMYHPDDSEKESGIEPDWVKSEREMFKDYRDKNADGKLDVEEMKDWIMPEGFDHAEAEARHLVGIADDDKDQKLSTAEILTHYETFVGSQATDYGEQLQRHDPSEL